MRSSVLGYTETVEWTKSKFLDCSSKWKTSNEIADWLRHDIRMNLRAPLAGEPEWIWDHQHRNANFGTQNLQRTAVSLEDFTMISRASLPSLVHRSYRSILHVISKPQLYSYGPCAKNLDFMHQTFPSCGGSGLGKKLAITLVLVV